MAKKINITAALATKKQELDTTEAAAREHVAYLKSQIGESEGVATLSAKQSAAVEEALAILTAAGVTV